MVSKLGKMIRCLSLRARWRSRIHFAFEWPKNCAGWKDAALRPIIKALPYTPPSSTDARTASARSRTT